MHGRVLALVAGSQTALLSLVFSPSLSLPHPSSTWSANDACEGHPCGALRLVTCRLVLLASHESEQPFHLRSLHDESSGHLRLWLT